MKKVIRVISTVIILGFLLPCAVSAELKPDEILIIANRNYPHSVEIAELYAYKRNVPGDHVLGLDLSKGEKMDRKAYNIMCDRVRAYIMKKGLKDRIRCLLLVYGVPLRIPDKETQAKKSETTSASVDSEISLLWWKDYPLEGWVINPLYHAFEKKPVAGEHPKVLMVARLDGHSFHDASRMMMDAIWAEKAGNLEGKVYLDARGFKSRDLFGAYDESLRRCEILFRQKTSFAVMLNDKPDLFPEGSAPNALFYCGWYSLKKYIPAFTWARGSVGYHIASREATSLRKGEYWCKRMIEEGITATFGPVEEPLLASFPLPSEFFYFLLQGEYTLAEVYYKSLRFLSWKMVLIGDPLYTPFRNYKGGVFNRHLQTMDFS